MAIQTPRAQLPSTCCVESCVEKPQPAVAFARTARLALCNKADLSMVRTGVYLLEACDVQRRFASLVHKCVQSRTTHTLHAFDCFLN